MDRDTANSATHLFVQLYFPVEVFLGQSFKILDLLGVVCFHLRHRRIQHRFASRADFLMCVRSGGQGFVVPGHSGQVCVKNRLGNVSIARLDPPDCGTGVPHKLYMGVRHPSELRAL